jgi:gag-polypeptide of LTR copia-type
MNGLWLHITTGIKPAADQEWDGQEEMLLGILEMYCQKDVWNAVSDNTKFASCKLKWDELKCIYGGVGAMSAFNSWVALTGTALEETKPMLVQLQKLNDACLTLTSNEMTITDLQFCFILIKALPKSYSTVTLTILATRAPADLKPQMIQEQILNEEGRQSGASTLLNRVAPMKKTSNVTCFYCKKPGHKSPECRKKKQDAE